MMVRPLAGLNLYEYINSFSNSILCAIIAAIPTIIFAMNVNLESQLLYLIIGCAIFAVIYLIVTYFTNKRLVDFFKSLKIK